MTKLSVENGKPETHCEKLLRLLSDHEFHNIIDLSREGWPGCVNVAIRSRISDLSHKGYRIEHKIDNNGCASYRLDYVSDPQSARQMCLI